MDQNLLDVTFIKIAVDLCFTFLNLKLFALALYQVYKVLSSFRKKSTSVLHRNSLASSNGITTKHYTQ